MAWMGLFWTSQLDKSSTEGIPARDFRGVFHKSGTSGWRSRCCDDSRRTDRWSEVCVSLWKMLFATCWLVFLTDGQDVVQRDSSADGECTVAGAHRTQRALSLARSSRPGPRQPSRGTGTGSVNATAVSPWQNTPRLKHMGLFMKVLRFAGRSLELDLVRQDIQIPCLKATKYYGLQSALKYLSYEPNIKALSQLEAEIQFVARVVAREWTLEDLTQISFVP